MSVTKDLNIFQISIMAIFLVIGAIGVVLFATSKSGIGGKNYKSEVWGVLSKSVIDASLDTYSIQGIDPNFTYTEFPEEGFDQVILQAVAEGRGPDAIVFPDTMYFGQINKLVTIPSATISSKTYNDTYIDVGKQFSVQGGIKAFPLITDPLVMYYNKNMFVSAGIVTPPKTWKDVADTVGKISLKNDAGVIERSSVALGEYSNITHAKDILYTLLAQAGIRVSFFDAGIGLYNTGLSKSSQEENNAGQSSASERTRSVLTYYTDFANPLKPTYTWNRSFLSSRDAFLSQKLAIYFGPGSEVQYIISRNPNLSFAIAPVPQENINNKVVHSKTYVLGFLITSKNIKSAYPEVTKFFTSDVMVQGLASAMYLAPAKRSLLENSSAADESSDLGVIYDSALYANTWVDPNETESDAVFKTLIESITSGKQTMSESVQDAGERLDRLYKVR